MILIYPNYYGLPVLKEEGIARGMRFDALRSEDEFWNEDIDIFKQSDDEYVEETIKK